MNFDYNNKIFNFKVESNESVKTLTFVPTDVAGDGNCFFRSLCIDKFFTTKNFNHTSLRQFVAKEIIDKVKKSKEMRNLATKFMKVRLNIDTISNDILFNELENIAKNGHWAGTFESMMMTLLFNIEIITLQVINHSTDYSSSIHSIKQYWKAYEQPCSNLHKI